MLAVVCEVAFYVCII